MPSMNKAPIIVPPHKFSKDRLNQDMIFTPLFFDILSQHNPHSDIVFINPNDFEISNHIRSVHSVPTAHLESARQASFKANYLHLSSNGYEFEMGCIERFFLIGELMRKEHLNAAFVVETDVMIFSDLNSHLETHLDARENYLIQNRCIGTAYVTLDFIDSYCTNILETYTSSQRRELISQYYQDYKETNLLGGICDMSFAYWMNGGEMAMTKTPSHDISAPFRSNNTLHELQGFDNFLSRSTLGDLDIVMNKSQVNEWRMKELRFINGYPHCLALDGKTVNLLSVHFQGRAKNLMGIAISMYHGRSTAIMP